MTLPGHVFFFFFFFFCHLTWLRTYCSMTDRRRLVVVGNGMVGHKLLETVDDLQSAPDRSASCGRSSRFCRSPARRTTGWPDSFFTGSTADDLSLVEDRLLERHGITVHLGDPARLDRHRAHTVTSGGGLTIGYDALVHKTGQRHDARRERARV